VWGLKLRDCLVGDAVALRSPLPGNSDHPTVFSSFASLGPATVLIGGCFSDGGLRCSVVIGNVVSTKIKPTFRRLQSRFLN
jgi:hypothetical protein